MPEKSETPKRGREHYSSAVLHKKREQKRLEAEERNKEYRSLSLSDRLKRAKSRRGESKKEVDRLTKLIAAEKK